MKVIFNMNGTNYIAPSKQAALDFLAYWNYVASYRQFETSWNLKTVERAPSYGQMQRVDLSNIEYK